LKMSDSDSSINDEYVDKLDGLLADQKKMTRQNDIAQKKMMKRNDLARKQHDINMKKLADQNNNLKKDIAHILDNFEQTLSLMIIIERKLDMTINNEILSTHNDNDNHVFYVIKYNDKPTYNDETNELTETFEYCVIRTQKTSINAKIKIIKTDHPHIKIIHKIKHTPNLTNLWTRIRNTLRMKGKIEGKNCDFNLINNYSQQNFIKFIQKIHDEHFDINL